ncbi:MAG: DUF6781 family protein [Phycisphaerales bacterium]
MNSDEVRNAARQAVESGDDIRERIRVVVEDAARAMGDRSEAATSRLNEIASAAIAGAASALDRAAPDDASSALRQVIDGLGDGFQRTAQATKLAVEEAGSSGKAFAAEDLKGVATDLTTLGEMFIETIERGAKGVLGEASGQATALRQHAERTLGGIRPSLEDAARAALANPAGLLGDTAGAAGNLARDAAGSLLSSVGKILGDAGNRVKKTDDPRR